MKKEKTNVGNGFGLRFLQAILCVPYLILYIVIALNLDGRQGYTFFDFIIYAIVVVLQFIVAVRGKKSKKANIFCVILNSIVIGYFGLAYIMSILSMYLILKDTLASPIEMIIALIGGFSVFGIIGGLKGIKFFEKRIASSSPVQTEYDQENTKYEKSETVTSDIAVAEVEDNKVYLQTNELDYIQPALSKKGKKAILICLSVAYSLLFLAGILLVAIPDLSSLISGMGICQEISARAYAITIGVMWLALTPSFGYYFATISPIEISLKKKLIIATATTVLLVVTNVIFFVVINSVTIEGTAAVKEFYETSDTWFIPVSMVFASLGIMLCYLLTLFKIDPARIKDVKPQKQGDGFFNAIKYCFMCLLGFIVKVIKGILKIKEKQPDIFILIGSILLTWLVFFTAFIFSIICIALFVGVIMLYFFGVCHWAYTPSNNSNKQVEINDCGVYKTLTLNPNIVEDRYEEVYQEENGTLWYSADGGKTVYKK